jgi:hypothetical protein
MRRIAVASAAKDLLHLVLDAELEFLELNFFEEVFCADVGGFGDFLELLFVCAMLLHQLLKFEVPIQQEIPWIPLQNGHASSSANEMAVT